jgi:bleomycin hydrolase
VKKIFLAVIFVFTSLVIYPQDAHQFTMIKEVKTTPVKNQAKSGTCWSFATTSFIETELLKKGFDELNLSEMYSVRRKLLLMAEKYIRYHGTSNFGDGGQAHDVLDAVRNYGMVPESVYSGMNIGLNEHNQGEMMAVLQGMLDGILKNKNGKLTPRWKEALEAVLNIYLGTPPEKFTYKGIEYTPETFAKHTGFNPDEYVEISSYSEIPMYSKFILPVPDNWANAEYYNVTEEDLVSIINNALEKGYSVCWDGDVSRDNFYRAEGYGVIPEENKKNHESNIKPENEKEITPKMRQKSFDDFDVTDDHLMHIVGLAKDQERTKFYYTKNSWGTSNQKYNGYWYLSENYIRLKTIAIMVNKDSIPEKIKEKLGI